MGEHMIRPLAVAGLCALLFGCAAQQTLSDRTAFSTDSIAGPAPWTHTRFPADSNQFSFAIVSDRTGGMRPEVFAKAVEKINLLRPDFVMSVGDLISGYTEDSLQLGAEWREFDSLVNRLSMPFFYTAGNHDITNASMRRLYERRRGRRYYHFVYKNVLFLILDSQDPLQGHRQAAIHQKQFAYAQKTLAEYPDVHWTYVFFHQPMWRGNNSGAWPRLEELLARRGHTVFAGHYHRYHKDVRAGGVYYILSTTGGGSTLRGPAFGEMDHITWVTATPEGPIVGNVLCDGILEDDPVDWKLVSAFDAIAQQGVVHISPVDFRDSSAGEIRIGIHNLANAPIRIRLHPQAHPALISGLERQWITLAPEQTDSIRAPVTLVNEYAQGAFAPAKIDCRIGVRMKTGQWRNLHETIVIPCLQQWQCTPVTNPISIDGALEDWGALAVACHEPAVIEFNADSWSGPEDGSFDFDVRYDNQFLYIGSSVIDDRVVTQTADTALAKPWYQDGIEIRLDARAEATRAVNRGAGEGTDFLLFALCPATGDKPPAVHAPGSLPHDSRYACIRTESGYAAEVAIPMGYITNLQGTNWDAVRVNVTVGDFDGSPEDRRNAAQLQWRPDWRGSNTYSGSGTFERTTFL